MIRISSDIPENLGYPCSRIRGWGMGLRKFPGISVSEDIAHAEPYPASPILSLFGGNTNS